MSQYSILNGNTVQANRDAAVTQIEMRVSNGQDPQDAIAAVKDNMIQNLKDTPIIAGGVGLFGSGVKYTLNPDIANNNGLSAVNGDDMPGVMKCLSDDIYNKLLHKDTTLFSDIPGSQANKEKLTAERRMEVNQLAAGDPDKATIITSGDGFMYYVSQNGHKIKINGNEVNNAINEHYTNRKASEKAAKKSYQKGFDTSLYSGGQAGVY